jgi:membrane protease YdiL (CAAX protease family)
VGDLAGSLVPVGIDVASQAKATAACWLRWHDHAVTLDRMEQPLNDDRLRSILLDELADKVGVVRRAGFGARPVPRPWDTRCDAFSVRLLAVGPDRTSRVLGLAAALIVIGGFLAGRRGYEALVSVLTGNGVGAGLSGVLAGALYAVFAAALAILALRIGRDPARLRDQLPSDGGPPQLLVGFCLGAGLVGATLALDLLSGRARVSGAFGLPSLTALGTGFLALGGVALAEELVFRFALLRVLAGATSWGTGALLSSLVYAAVHASAGRVWPVYLATLFGFGIVACELTAIGGSLWLPIGGHWAWDFVSFAAFQSLPLTLLGPSWVAGLPYRLSAGLVMLIVMALTVVVLVLIRRALNTRHHRSRTHAG